MLSPLDLQNKKIETRKKKYDKAEMDEYLALIFENYTELYNKNLDLEKKVKTLSDGIQYYRSIESTMQKALVLAEKTSKETKDAAILKAEAIEKDANSKAAKIVSEAEQEYEKLKDRCVYLVQQFNQYKMQLRQVATAQLELITSDSFDVYSPELDKLQKSSKKISDSKAKSASPDRDLQSLDPVSPEPAPQAPSASGSVLTPMDRAEEELNTLDIDGGAREENMVSPAPDLGNTTVISDLKAELEEKIAGKETDTLSVLTADTIDLSHPIREVQKMEEEQSNTILRPLSADTVDVQDALVVEPVDAFPAEPSEKKPKDAQVSELEIEKLEPIPEKRKEKEAPTLDALLQSMNISSKKKKKKGQEEDPFEFLGSVDDF